MAHTPVVCPARRPWYKPFTNQAESVVSGLADSNQIRRWIGDQAASNFPGE
jgi:hypothetical protein